jgi:TolB-like protein/Flp pilus assembly protein TadD
MERRLAAIVVADVVGYSRLIGADEEGTLAALSAHRQELIDPLISDHGGRIANTAGDSLLIEFSSAVGAVRCALAIQQGLAERNADVEPDCQIHLRIGVNVGDVVASGDDLLGDGVNVAARLQEIAEPGGLCLSRDAYGSVGNRVAATFVSIGPQQLKNIAQPVEVWRWSSVQTPPRPGPDRHAGSEPESQRPELSIVVLPFINLSRDPEQEFFVDGLTESLTTELSRMVGCLVIARNSAFAYKGKTVHVSQIGSELGVRYVLEGSVQTAGNRVRVNAQLIDAESGAHLWAERFDSARSDIFDMQDEIVSRLARTLSVELTAAEAGRAERLRSQDPDSTDLALRGWAELDRKQDPDAWRTALDLFQRAVHLDAANADAQAGMSVAHSYLVINYATDQRDEHIREAEAAALRALALAPNGARSHIAYGRALIATDRTEQGIGELERALSLDPNQAHVHGFIAMALRFAGRPEETEARALKALQISPRDVFVNVWYFQVGVAALQLGQFDKAVVWLRRSIEAHRNFAPAHFLLGSALAYQGATSEATAAIADGLIIDPGFSIQRIRDGPPSSNPTFLAGWEFIIEGMKKAGVPE